MKLAGMDAREMGVALEDDTAVERRIVAPGKAVEQRPRRALSAVIVARTCVTPACAGRVSSSSSIRLASPWRVLRARPRPARRRRRLVRRAGDAPKSNRECAAAFGDDAIVGEMGALDQIEVARIAVERRAGRDQRGDRRPVGSDRLAKLQRRGGRPDGDSFADGAVSRSCGRSNIFHLLKYCYAHIRTNRPSMPRNI
ncbi:hypothetical protein [Sphingopyxis terrae]|uniref:hypothetical protein n=1 Tax=Sphingopyxis terrae TaxID=33052 RepID=UPI00363FEDD1